MNFVNLTQKQKDTVRRWRNHENVRKWMYQDHTISPEEHTKFVEILKVDDRNFYWLVKKNKDEYIGVVSLNAVDLRNKNARLGIYSNPDCKSSKPGYILIECLKKLAFDIVHLHTLTLEVIDNNQRAIDFYKKSGFSNEGKLREYVFKNGNWYDVIVMGIIKKDQI